MNQGTTTLSSATSGEQVSELISQLAAVDTALEHALGRGTDTVIDSLGQAHYLRHAQASLQQSENRFRALIERSSDVITLLAVDGSVLYDSPAIMRVLGFAPAQLVGQNLFLLIHPEDRTRARQVLARVRTTPDHSASLSFRCRHQTGAYRSLEGTATNLLDAPGVKALLLNYRDVTERHEAESSLRQSKERFRTMLQGVDAGVVVHGANARITAFNAKAIELLGVSEDQMAGRAGAKASMSWIRIDGAPVPEEELPHRWAFASRMPVRNVILGVIRPGHHDRAWILVNANPVLTPQGAVAEVIVTLVDVTSRIDAERELSASENRLKALFEQAAVGVAEAEVRTGRFLRVNQRYADIVGYTRGEMGRLTLDEITHAADVGLDSGRMVQLRSGCIREYAREKRYIRKDGSAVWVSLTVSAIGPAGEAPSSFMAVVTDISERKQIEEHLRQMEKMEAVGQLSSGVAHDFNNLLTVIQGHVGLVETQGGVSGDVADSLREISHATARATALTRQLLTFSRKQAMHARHIDANEVVKNMGKMLRRVLREDIRLEVRYAPATAPLHADVGMIEQVLVNLVVNARDAMPDGGKLTIEVARSEISLETAKLSAHARPGPFVRLTITDTGTGIAPQVRSKIFEPFFTTKQAGQGTGLGLANVYGIVHQHSGWIEVQTEIGQGTTFRVYLPERNGSAAAPMLSAPSLEFPRGTETFLLVEDDLLVRLVMEPLLQRHGYRVLTAADATKALEIWRHHASIRLLLTDLILRNGMGGQQLAESLMVQDPSLRVIYTSGYVTEVAGKKLSLREGVNFLAKPLDPGRLLRTLRARLDEPAGGVQHAGSTALHRPPPCVNGEDPTNLL